MNTQRIICGLFLAIMMNAAQGAAHVVKALPTIKVHHPVLTLSDKNAKDARLLFEMVNQSQHPQTLIAAYSPLAKRTHLDQHSVGTHGFRLDSVTVAPKVHYEFEPKGTTIRMHEFVKPIRSGDMVPVTLIFSDGRNIKLLARAEIHEAKVG